MIVNVMHRPASGELYSMFRLQQKFSHDLKLKTTIMVPYDFMFQPDVIADIKADSKNFGDEIGIWLGDCNTEMFTKKIGCKEAFIWLLKEETKEKVIRSVIDKFHEVFGFYPKTFGAYHMDAVSMRILKEVCPSIKISVSGCFEEGVKVFHGCNNSWYLFNEGMPFFPWYPARENTLRPAESKEDWTGIVAVPHLARDLALSFEGRNDFFASHPANVQRAMANRGAAAPYVLNLLDVYRYQERFNNGFSYTNVFVGPNWLHNSPNVQDSDEITQGLYREYLEYFASLREKGELTDMYMSEFADWFTENVSPESAQIYDAKDVLYGSGKDYVWFCDSEMRVTFDMCQGATIGDFRPYIARQPRCTGADTPFKAYGSNPYLIHSQYRSGNAHHFEDGSRSTLLLSNGKETLDLANYPSAIKNITRTENGMELTVAPLSLDFKDGTHAVLNTSVKMKHGGEITFERSLSELTGCASLTVSEYFKGCWGVTEYPEDMTAITLNMDAPDGKKSYSYSYEGRTFRENGKMAVSADIPNIETSVSLVPAEGNFTEAEIDEGYVFNPYYTLRETAELSTDARMVTRVCLKKL